jgi:hypothetical protein
MPKTQISTTRRPARVDLASLRLSTDAFRRQPDLEAEDTLGQRILCLPYVVGVETEAGIIEVKCTLAELPRVTAELQRHLSAPIARGEKGTRVWKDSLHDGHYSLVYDPGAYVFGCVAYRNLPRGPRVPCI